jgi:hypothetical protein
MHYPCFPAGMKYLSVLTFKGHGFIYIYGTHLYPVVYLVSPAQTADLPFRAVVPLQQSKLGSYVCNPGLQKHLEIK